MRSKNATRNLIAYFVYEALVFMCGIIFPRFIISIYGSEINGLSSTISRLLSIVNLIQAGAVGAAVFQMYKPVAENDYETQSAILYSSRRYYNKITIFYIISSILLGVIYGFYLQNESLDFIHIFMAFFILGLSGSFALFLTSICDIYVSPHQKLYYLKISGFANLVVHYGFLSIVLFLKLPFLFIYISILLGSSINALLNYIFYKKLTKGRITNNPVNKNFKIPNRGYLMVSTIGTEAIRSSPAIIITSFIGLVSASVFSVYSMIFVSLKTVLASIQYSISPIFGNLVKTSDDKHVSEVHDTIGFINFFFGTFICICLGFLIIPFVKAYTHGITEVEYVYPLLAYFVVVYVLLIVFKQMFGYVATVYGLFKQISTITTVFSILGILMSVVFVILFGLPYVMCGLIFYEIGSAIGTLIVLKKKIHWFTITKTIIRTFVMISFTTASSIIYNCLRIDVNSLKEWLLIALVVSAISFSTMIVYCFVFERKQIFIVVKYIRNILKKKSR